MKRIISFLNKIGVPFVAGLAGGAVAFALISYEPSGPASVSSDISVKKVEKAQGHPYEKLCADEISAGCFNAPVEDGGVIGCLLGKSSLNQACRESLSVYANRLSPCQTDSDKFCPGVSVGRAQLVKCLRYYKSQIKNQACLNLL